MSLTGYKKKRNFRKTPEPEGRGRAEDGPLHFVVQKHAATRLHYDFRLELDGVLKSWAVPKGPPLEPGTKRLAMMVEDHPLEYRKFQGEIPEGNYGAGTVEIWDEGTYEAAEGGDPAEGMTALRRGLRNGELTFVLHGKKLDGGFALVKTSMGGRNAWLLIKRKESPEPGADAAADRAKERKPGRLVQGRKGAS